MTKRLVVPAGEPEIVLTSPGIADLSPGSSVPWNLQVSQAMAAEGLSPGDRRRAVLVALGVRQPRQKYKSKKQKKTAAKERREKRKSERSILYEQYGITPRTRGPKLTPEAKRQRRSERGKKRRELLREMARKDPEMAKKYGVDPSRFKL